MSNMASKVHVTHETPPPLIDSHNANLSLVQEVKALDQPTMRHKVLTRKRKRSQHPLRELRIRTGLTLEELSDLTKMSPSYLSRLESGSRRLNADIIQRLAVALECNPAELLPYTSFAGTSYAAPLPATGSSAPPVDLPVYTLKATPAGIAFLENTQAEQWITRPTDFLGVADAFACAVNDAQWAPRYMDGDRLLVHPTAPLKKGCSVIVTTQDQKTFLGTFQGIEGMGATQSFNIETSFSKEVEALSFKQSDIKAFRITGTLDAA